MGEGDNLQVNQMTGFFAHFQQRLERTQRGIGHVDMGAHVLNAVLSQHPNGGMRALLGVFKGDGFLALGPALNPFEQRTAEVPLGLAGSQDGVQMNMWFDQRCDQQLALGIDVACLCRHGASLQRDSADAFAFACDGVQTWGFTQCGIDDVHARSCRWRVQSDSLMTGGALVGVGVGWRRCKRLGRSSSRFFGMFRTGLSIAAAVARRL